jgi:glycosyltransferase involved in cell wall biosynthesis
MPDVSDRVQEAPTGKWSQFFGALAQRFDLVDVVRPEVSAGIHCLNLARAFHPSLRNWRSRAGFNQYLLRKRTEAVQQGLWRHQGSYDLIMQLQTLCAPGRDRAGVPYTIYTDSTMALLRRFYPAGAPLSADAVTQGMRFEADVCQAASVVFTFSEFARRSVVDDYGCSPDRVVAVGAGANQLVGEFAQKHCASPRALFVGGDFTRKGGRVLVEAWPLVRARVPDAELVIAGPRRSPKRRDHAGLRWVGRVDRDVLAALYQSASVFVLPSLFEPWGHVFLEAMGHGLPCIGTSCCAMPEIISDGITGRLLPPGNADELARVLIELLTDDNKMTAMGRAAHSHVLHGNRWSDVIERVAIHLSVSADSHVSSEPTPSV